MILQTLYDEYEITIGENSKPRFADLNWPRRRNLRIE